MGRSSKGVDPRSILGSTGCRSWSVPCSTRRPVLEPGVGPRRRHRSTGRGLGVDPGTIRGRPGAIPDDPKLIEHRLGVDPGSRRSAGDRPAADPRRPGRPGIDRAVLRVSVGPTSGRRSRPCVDPRVGSVPGRPRSTAVGPDRHPAKRPSTMCNLEVSRSVLRCVTRCSRNVSGQICML